MGESSFRPLPSIHSVRLVNKAFVHRNYTCTGQYMQPLCSSSALLIEQAELQIALTAHIQAEWRPRAGPMDMITASHSHILHSTYVEVICLWISTQIFYKILAYLYPESSENLFQHDCSCLVSPQAHSRCLSSGCTTTYVFTCQTNTWDHASKELILSQF